MAKKNDSTDSGFSKNKEPSINGHTANNLIDHDVKKDHYFWEKRLSKLEKKLLAKEEKILSMNEEHENQLDRFDDQLNEVSDELNRLYSVMQEISHQISVIFLQRKESSHLQQSIDEEKFNLDLSLLEKLNAATQSQQSLFESFAEKLDSVPEIQRELIAIREYLENNSKSAISAKEKVPQKED